MLNKELRTQKEHLRRNHFQEEGDSNSFKGGSVINRENYLYNLHKKYLEIQKELRDTKWERVLVPPPRTSLTKINQLHYIELTTCSPAIPKYQSSTKGKEGLNTNFFWEGM